MLDEDTLNRLPDLTASTLYSAEIAHLPRRSRAEEHALVARARQGDSEARQVLIESCLQYALRVSRTFYSTHQLSHDDLLDLAQIASERMVAQMDKALAASEPCAYLRGIARQAIWAYCTYHSGLIKRPHYTNAMLDRLDPKPAVVESLDAPLSRDGRPIKVKLIEAPAVQPERDERSQQQRYAALYKAVSALPKKQQETIVRLYGLFGHLAETPSDIGRLQTVHNHASRARQRLRAMLADSLDELEPPASLRKEQGPKRRAGPNGDEKLALSSEVQHDGNAGDDPSSTSHEARPITEGPQLHQQSHKTSEEKLSATSKNQDGKTQPDPINGPVSDLIEPTWIQQSGVNEPTTELPVDRHFLDSLDHRPSHEQWER
jgi:DNA-directed RNA polymerase specialized sigma24 family protein